MKNKIKNDILLTCVILLTFEHRFAADETQTHLTVSKAHEMMSEYFDVELSKVAEAMKEMCVGGILTQWELKDKEGNLQEMLYTLKKFEKVEGKVRVIDTTP